jgi:hypothetical protein
MAFFCCLVKSVFSWFKRFASNFEFFSCFVVAFKDKKFISFYFLLLIRIFSFFEYKKKGEFIALSPWFYIK